MEKKQKRKQSPRPGKTTLAIEFDKNDLDKVRAAAWEEQRSIGFIVRRAVQYWLENSPEGRFQFKPTITTPKSGDKVGGRLEMKDIDIEDSAPVTEERLSEAIKTLRAEMLALKDSKKEGNE